MKSLVFKNTGASQDGGLGGGVGGGWACVAPQSILKRSHGWMASLVLVIVGLGLLSSVGCQYSQGSEHLYDTQYHSVVVPIFENRTFDRGIEHRLTEALIKEVQTRTPYAIGTPGGSDTLLQGTIVSVERQRITRSRIGGVPLENEIRLLVDFEWKDLRTGQTLRSRKGYVSAGTHVTMASMYEPESIAFQTAIDRLAEDIVTVMQADWGAAAH